MEGDAMSDVLKAGGAVAGLGFGGAILLLAWRVYNDDAMSWMVVTIAMVVVVLAAAAVVLALYRQALDSRSVLLARSQEDRLMSARVSRTWDRGQDGGGGLLPALLAGQDESNVIDAPSTMIWSQSPAAAGGEDDGQ